MTTPSVELHFGGPDRPPRALSDLLLRHVNAAQPGDGIHWVTYYFRDRPLARALMAASDRGVNVTVLVEGAPRRRSANRAVLDMLQQHGLGGGLTICRPAGLLRKLHPHLHAKLYLFTGSQMLALLGSFNPSGDDPEEDPDVIAEIGDQDRGHNMLVGIADPRLVDELQQQVALWHRHASRLRLRLLAMQNRVLHAGALVLRFYPRLRTRVVEHELARMGAGDRISGALSHVKPGPFTQQLCRAADRGAAVNLIVHDTERRVPEAMLQQLRARGVRLRRYRHPARLPVHAKYLLLERPGSAQAWFGSFNFNGRSRMLNLEILVQCTDAVLVAALQARFADLEREVQLQTSPEE